MLLYQVSHPFFKLVIGSRIELNRRICSKEPVALQLELPLSQAEWLLLTAFETLLLKTNEL